jgi:hypothetical protein
LIDAARARFAGELTGWLQGRGWLTVANSLARARAAVMFWCPETTARAALGAMLLAVVVARFSGSGLSVFVLSFALITSLVCLLPVLGEDRTVQWAVGAAFAFRLLLAIGLYLVSVAGWSVLGLPTLGGGLWEFGRDALYWDVSARALLGRDVPALNMGWGLAGQPDTWNPFTSVVALTYWLFGEHLLVPIMLNAWLGALTVLFAAAVVQRLGAPRGARLLAWALAVWPSFLLWSTQLLKESLVTFLVIYSLWALLIFLDSAAALRWRHQVHRATALASIGAAMLVLYFLRPPIALAWLAAAVLTGVGWRVHRGWPRRMTVVHAVLLGGILLTVTAGLVAQATCLSDHETCEGLVGETVGTVDDAIYTVLHRRWVTLREEGTKTAIGNVALGEGWELIPFAPVAVANTFLAPYPWTWFSMGKSLGAMRLVSSLEMIVEYAVLPWLVVGSWLALRRHGLPAIFLLALLLVLGLVIGNTIMNEGTLFRIRIVALLPLLILAAAGLDAPRAAPPVQRPLVRTEYG